MADAEIVRSAPERQDPRATAGAPTVTSKWRRYLADLQSATAEPLPLETQGRLVRVTGLVLEAAGIRVPVGSVCEIHQDGRGADASPPVIAEVVGFSGDRAYLMPTGDVHGLSSGALRRAAALAGDGDEARHRAPSVAAHRRPHACTCRSATACSAASSIRKASRWTARARSRRCTTSR